MVKTERPSTWMTETLLNIHLTADYSVGTPGIRVYAVSGNRKGIASYHWPTVQRKITASQLDDIESAVVDLVRGKLWHAGWVKDLVGDET